MPLSLSVSQIEGIVSDENADRCGECMGGRDLGHQRVQDQDPPCLVLIARPVYGGGGPRASKASRPGPPLPCAYARLGCLGVFGYEGTIAPPFGYGGIEAWWKGCGGGCGGGSSMGDGLLLTGLLALDLGW